eukprot:evm.model.NODE_4801_length_9671_cov_37.551338.3
MPVEYKDVELESGCFAYARVPGHPLWPCVVYNHWEEIPPEFAGRVKKLIPKPGQVIVYFIEHWTFSMVPKTAVKSVQDVSDTDALKSCKNSKQKQGLRLAIESMLSMQIQSGEDIAVCVHEEPAVPAPDAATATTAATAAASTATSASATADDSAAPTQKKKAPAKKLPPGQEQQQLMPSKKESKNNGGGGSKQKLPPASSPGSYQPPFGASAVPPLPTTTDLRAAPVLATIQSNRSSSGSKKKKPTMTALLPPYATSTAAVAAAAAAAAAAASMAIVVPPPLATPTNTDTTKIEEGLQKLAHVLNPKLTFNTRLEQQQQQRCP